MNGEGDLNGRAHEVGGPKGVCGVMIAQGCMYIHINSCMKMPRAPRPPMTL